MDSYLHDHKMKKMKKKKKTNDGNGIDGLGIFFFISNMNGKKNRGERVEGLKG